MQTLFMILRPPQITRRVVELFGFLGWAFGAARDRDSALIDFGDGIEHVRRIIIDWRYSASIGICYKTGFQLAVKNQ